MRLTKGIVAETAGEKKYFNVCDNETEWDKLMSKVAPLIKDYDYPPDRLCIIECLEYEINYHDLAVFHRPINPSEIIRDLCKTNIQVYYKDGRFFVTDNVLETKLDLWGEDWKTVFRWEPAMDGELLWECPIIKIMYGIGFYLEENIIINRTCEDVILEKAS